MSVSDFNTVLGIPTVRTAVRFLGTSSSSFNSRRFVESLATHSDHQAVNVRQLLAASEAAGAVVSGAYAQATELDTIPVPFLTFLKPKAGREAAGLGLFEIKGFDGRQGVVVRDLTGLRKMSRKELAERWSGVVLLLQDSRSAIDMPSAELEDYRPSVELLPGVLTKAECDDLIEYCEEACFSRSRVMQRRMGETRNIVRQYSRSSTSVVLKDRKHPLLARLYAYCAALEGVGRGSVEQIQGVRYKRGQKFRPHHDGGPDLPRMTTYLLYLNDDFEGGETFFPLLDLAVRPQAGSCLRFPSCDREGRVLWQSEHGGLPVKSGVKYALNIWVRCPKPPVQPPMGVAAPAGARLSERAEITS